MKFLTIYQAELRHQTRNIATWLLLVLLFFFGFGVMRLVTLEDGVYLNAPSTIAFFTVFASAIWLVLGGVVSGEAGTRDFQHRIHPIMFTTPVSKATYINARFLGALTVNTLILLSVYLGFGVSFYTAGAREEYIGPFRLASYVTNYCFIAFPTALVATSIQFAFAVLTRRAISAYIASLVIIIFSQFAGTTVRFALEWKLLGTLMDLLGTSLVMEMEGWTPIQKNTQLVLPEGNWLWNRLFWLILTVGTILITHWKFKVAHGTALWPSLNLILHRRKHERTDEQRERRRSIQCHLSGQPIVFRFSTYLLQTVEIARNSFAFLVGNRWGVTIVGLLAIGTGLFASEYMEWLGVPLLARTQEVLRIFAPPLDDFKTQWVVIPALIIFYAGEVIWRERENGLNELVDTTPVRESAVVTGKFIGLALLILTWTLLLICGGIINQVVMNYNDFQLEVWFKAILGIQLTTYWTFAMIIFAIHVFVNQKYVGYIAGFGIYGFILFHKALGVEHKMLVFASDTGWTYSDMRGFAPYIQSLLSFKIYWLVLALIMIMTGSIFWIRSKETSVRTRVRIAAIRLKRYKLPLMILSGIFLVTGIYIFYNTNIRNPYRNLNARKEMRASYEQRYGKFEKIAQPRLTDIRLNVDLYPESGSGHIRGVYKLKNVGQQAIDSLHVSCIPFLNTKILLSRRSTAKLIDEELGYRIYELEEPLQPNQTLELIFDFSVGKRGFSNEGVDVSIVPNGTHLTDAWMPSVGYDADRRLRSALDRKQFGLPPRDETVSLYDTAALQDDSHAQKIRFEAVVSTTPEQIAIAPGTLKKTSIKDGRKYYHYVTDSPILNEFAFFSARYKVRQEAWSAKTGNSAPVDIQIYYHPKHHHLVERMMQSAKASLEYYSAEFGPYPYKVFRVVERPGAGRGMHAEPMTIDYQEGYSLMNPGAQSPDLPYHIMSHEVAHQWWGISCVPAKVEGAGFLIESFATYSAMQVVEADLGYDDLLKYLSEVRHEYEVPRSRAATPLLTARDRFQLYRKGPFALYALRNYIGKDKVNEAMRSVLYAKTLPTSLHFYQHIKSVTPDSLQYLVEDLLATNTIWKLRITKAVARMVDQNEWEVTLTLHASKTRIDTVGNEEDIPMHDWMEIGIYGERTDHHANGKPIYLRKHQVFSGQQEINIRVSERPARAGVDPNHLLIDFEMDDNFQKINSTGSAEKTLEKSLID